VYPKFSMMSVPVVNTKALLGTTLLPAVSTGLFAYGITKMKTKEAPITKLATVPRLAVTQAPSLIQKTTLVPVTKLKETTIVKTPPVTVITPIVPVTQPKLLPTLVPPVTFMLGGYPKGKGKKGYAPRKTMFGYMPSFKSAVFNLTTRKKPEPNRFYSPFELRKIYIPKKSKKSRWG
jgi:hypothetical protein